MRSDVRKVMPFFHEHLNLTSKDSWFRVRRTSNKVTDVTRGVTGREQALHIQATNLQQDAQHIPIEIDFKEGCNCLEKCGVNNTW